jgi:hypothetical protein
VIYGHDAKKGLQIHDFTKGLDSNCAKGGELSAFMIESAKGKVSTSIVGMGCAKERVRDGEKGGNGG